MDPYLILNELFFKINRPINPIHDLIIFNEIQNCPKALTSLKYFCEDMPQLAIAATGSLLGIYLTEESFPVGKVNFIRLHPLSFEEYLMAHQEDPLLALLRSHNKIKIPFSAHERLWKRYLEFNYVGGLRSRSRIYPSQRKSNRRFHTSKKYWILFISIYPWVFYL